MFNEEFLIKKKETISFVNYLFIHSLHLIKKVFCYNIECIVHFRKVTIIINPHSHGNKKTICIQLYNMHKYCA